MSTKTIRGTTREGGRRSHSPRRLTQLYLFQQPRSDDPDCKSFILKYSVENKRDNEKRWGTKRSHSSVSPFPWVIQEVLGSQYGSTSSQAWNSLETHTSRKREVGRKSSAQYGLRTATPHRGMSTWPAFLRLSSLLLPMGKPCMCDTEQGSQSGRGHGDGYRGSPQVEVS